MPLRIRCQCGKTLNVSEEKAGKQVKCPECSGKVVVPPKPKTVPLQQQGEAAKPASGVTRPKPRPAQPPPQKKNSATTPAKGPPPRKKSKSQPAKPASPPPLPKDKPTPASGKSKPPAAPPTSPSSSSPMPPPKESAKPASGNFTEPVAPPPAAPPTQGESSETKIQPAGEQSSPLDEPVTEEIRGVEHDPGKKWTVYQLGCCVALLGLAGMYPAVAEVVRHFTDFDSRGIESWTWFVFLLAGIQLVYALYMVQLPDWSTLWIVMIISAVTSVFYAMALGIALMSGEENAIITSLGLSNLQRAGYMSLWCFMMTLLTSLLTYFLVRASLKWQKAYELATAGR